MDPTRPDRFGCSVRSAALAVAGLTLVARGASAQERPPSTQTAPVASSPPTYAWLPTIRFGFGAHVPTEGSAGFAFDVSGGLMYASYEERPRLMFLPELGYSYDGASERGGHYFTAGAGLLYGTTDLAAGVSSRAVLGDAQGHFAAGVRNSVVVQTFITGLIVEIGHQWVRAASEDRHEFRAVLLINPIGLFLARLKGSIAPRG